MNLTATDMNWIQRAIKEARKSKHRVRVGAAVVNKKNGSVAHNKIRNSPMIDWENASTHAESAALRKSPRTREGSVVYIARLGARGALLPSYPCERCIPELVDAKVKRLVYWNGDRWVKERLPRL